jgi:membrane protease YdiL (CAAX protease family)
VVTVDSLRVLVALGLTGLLIMLRLGAREFSAAEYNEPTIAARHSFVRRLLWYTLGCGLIAALLLVHPAPATDLGMTLGDRTKALIGGFGIGALGTAQAVLFALWRYGRLRYPPMWSYPGAVLNAIGTAFIDEVTFRGALLGFLLLTGLDPRVAITIQALVYALATRTGSHGWGGYPLLLSLGIGFVCGWVTVWTGAIGAAFIGHSITRIAVFACTGHAGQPLPRGREVEETWEGVRPPEGWRPPDRGDPARVDDR